MATLKEIIQHDAIGALKEKRPLEASVLRFALAEIHNREIEEGKALSDEATCAVLRKEMKKREEAVRLFEQGKRNDLASREKEEMEILNRYLPALMGNDDITRVVERLIASGLVRFPDVIREAMKEAKGKADGRVVSDIVREKLGERAS